MKFALLMVVAILLPHGWSEGPADDSQKTELAPATYQGAYRFDDYGEISSNDEKARLDYYAVQLQQDPQSTGFIIAYGRRTRPGEAKKRADSAKHYLWYNRRIETSRVTSLDHCFSTKLEVELWIVPAGASPPTCKNRTRALKDRRR